MTDEARTEEAAPKEDIRTVLGLPPSMSDEEVQRYVADLRARALGNLAGPKGWTGVAEGADAVVFESYSDTPVEALGLPDFDGTVEMVQYTPVDGGTRVAVRVRKEDR